MTDVEKKIFLEIMDSRNSTKKEFYVGKILDDSFVVSDNKDKRFYKAVNINGTGVSNNMDYFCLLNKTEHDLKTGDSVLVHALNGDLSNSYIMESFGSTGSTVVAYESTGDNGTIYMNCSCEGAKYAEIFFRDQEYSYGYTKIANPNGKIADLTSTLVNNTRNMAWTKSKRISINNQTIQNLYYGEIQIPGDTAYEANLIYITKIILYF